MNRREAIAASVAMLFAGAMPKGRRAADFDPFFVWRQSARFDRDVLEPIQRRFALAMAEKLDREWGE